MILDVEIVETGNGGDALLVGRDLRTVSGWNNMVYLAMFGGNLAQSTGVRNAAEQDFSYWANALLYADEPNFQFNSLTERTLNGTALNSSGRLIIEQAIAKDLAFMQAFAEINIETEITAPDRLEIRIRVTKPEQLEEQVFIFLWDGINASLVAGENALQTSGGDFNNDFNNDFN